MELSQDDGVFLQVGTAAREVSPTSPSTVSSSTEMSNGGRPWKRDPRARKTWLQVSRRAEFVEAAETSSHSKALLDFFQSSALFLSWCCHPGVNGEAKTEIVLEP
eukprot:TRINITY_DN97373_c0_g1_i1.p1 TRINITY_DN97373_c0_g1~~TRINITY_DN97373_c0_g1_i1.p1  ORF type:complete len:105 (+),score=18.60 TRINITY_DN97373_c0_g1_i1:106-420(+)